MSAFRVLFAEWEQQGVLRSKALIYTLGYVIVLYVNLSKAYRFSSNFKVFARYNGLQPGWLPWIEEPKMDLKDAQYSSFRSNALLLVVVFGSFWIGSVATRMLHKTIVTQSSGAKNSKSSDSLLRWRTTYYATFSIVFVVVMHGSNVAYLFSLMAVNYMISELCAHPQLRAFGMVLTWIFGCGVVLLNEVYKGYRPFAYSSIPIVGSYLEFLEGYPGLNPWHHRFPLVMLRMVSFNMDRAWSLQRLGNTNANNFVDVDHKRNTDKLRDTKRESGLLEPDPRKCFQDKYYSGLMYTAYILYPPLYLAGPIITCNSFIASAKGDAPTNTMSKKLFFGLRSLGCFLTFEVFLHYFYVHAIAKSPQFFPQLLREPLWCAVFGYMGVNFLYLKFLTLWRFFRFWAILDDVVPPENMPQCIIMTTTISNFWRGWHSSFNKWLIRYLYVPLGGRLDGTGLYVVARKIFNIAVVFTFVAVWHDQTMSLLAWSWVLIASMIPEQLASVFMSTPQGASFRKHWLFPHARAMGGVFCIILLIVANTVGFSAGLKGTFEMIKASLLKFDFLTLKMCAVLFINVHFNFEFRGATLPKSTAMKRTLPVTSPHALRSGVGSRGMQVV